MFASDLKHTISEKSNAKKYKKIKPLRKPKTPKLQNVADLA